MLKKLFFIFCFAVLLTACPEPLPLATINIINQSQEDIFWLRSSKVTSEWYEINSIESWLKKHDTYVILRGNSSKDVLNSDGIKCNLRNDGWFKYTLFNYDSIKTIPWQRICEERIILKEVRFDSWEDFESCNFTITYP